MDNRSMKYSTLDIVIWSIIGVTLTGAAIGGWFFLTPETGGARVSSFAEAPLIVNSLPTNNAPSKGSPTKAVKILDPDKSEAMHLKDNPQATKMILHDVVGSNTTGSAYVLATSRKITYAITAYLAPLANPSDFYAAWLFRESPRRQYVPLGKLEKIPENAFFTLDNSISGDYPNFPDIIVTLETKGDKTPEQFILRGTFQP